MIENNVLAQTPSCMSKAGILTPGSFYHLRLPDILSVAFAGFVPGYSGGPVPDFHGIPFCTLEIHFLFFRKEFREGTYPGSFVRSPGFVYATPYIDRIHKFLGLVK